MSKNCCGKMLQPPPGPSFVPPPTYSSYAQQIPYPGYAQQPPYSSFAQQPPYSSYAQQPPYSSYAQPTQSYAQQPAYPSYAQQSTFPSYGPQQTPYSNYAQPQPSYYQQQPYSTLPSYVQQSSVVPSYPTTYAQQAYYPYAPATTPSELTPGIIPPAPSAAQELTYTPAVTIQNGTIHIFIVLSVSSDACPVEYNFSNSQGPLYDAKTVMFRRVQPGQDTTISDNLPQTTGPWRLSITQINAPSTHFWDLTALENQRPEITIDRSLCAAAPPPVLAGSRCHRGSRIG